MAIFIAAVSVAAQERKPLLSSEQAKDVFSSKDATAKLAKEYEAKASVDYAEGKIIFASSELYAAKFFALALKYGGSAQMLSEIISRPDTLEEFVCLLAPEDDAAKVFEILSNIQKASPEKFSKYISCAAAIALVFDTPPPAVWPHAQVSEIDLPRKFQNPVEWFLKIADMREKGRFLLPTEKLSIQEAKFAVATLADDSDREWAQKSISSTLANIEKLYPSIVYDNGRISEKAFVWRGGEYRLKNIKSRGGICTDQAYFTSETAKARGVPALIFIGAGSDGFHAWTAYMLKSGSWKFDVGRYANARFVTGTTMDPQTWKPATDHSLNAMRESFRNSPKYALCLAHAAFAEYFLKKKNFENSTAAARAAIAADPRNADAWNILIESLRESENAAAARAVLAEAAKSFSQYPDIDADFRKRLIDELNARGESEAAEKLSSSIILKTKNSRPDIAMRFARLELEGKIADDNIDKLNSSYKRLLGVFKSDPAMCIGGIAIPIMNALLAQRKFDKAAAVMKITKQTFKSSKDASITAAIDDVSSQLERIISKVENAKTN